jgi:tRNA A37 threonylcarbamoyladenosine synthetase subunit TsaC/SUA5/YrdC
MVIFSKYMSCIKVLYNIALSSKYARSLTFEILFHSAIRELVRRNETPIAGASANATNSAAPRSKSAPKASTMQER